ncbi:hypothetical protein X805_18030 [Sphaerotilus natans subsp. natans DSM 6575]|uniref:Uncharacterized protein n=1 Tax=Sphaerotilus natans subsp. natans DSM 6575 TaxID=1286631 RepID=A0A059KNC5_9BURK|nr:hypothetical protein X805_18030 [Sphaerotilus natans subsp. natans DSM 6575]
MQRQVRLGQQHDAGHPAGLGKGVEDLADDAQARLARSADTGLAQRVAIVQQHCCGAVMPLGAEVKSVHGAGPSCD